MFTTGTRCSSTEGPTAWSLLITGSSDITYNLKAYCRNASQAETLKSFAVVSLPNINIQSSTCGATPTAIELKFDKNGFSYSCNSSVTFTSGTFDIQLRNKQNTTQSTTITINKAGTISQN